MIKRSFLLLLVMDLLLPTQTLAEPQKPLVLGDSQAQKLQTQNNMRANATPTLGSSINISEGQAPSSPHDGDLWATASGIYARINGITVGPLAQSVSSQRFIDPNPVFTNSQYNSGFQFLANGARPGPWYNAQQVNSYATDALTSAILVPPAAAVHQVNGLASYIHTERAQPANGGDVAAYFQGQCAASNCAVFSLNTLASDSAGMTGQKIGVEIDNNVNSSDTTVNGINLVLSGNLIMSGYANGYTCRIGYGEIKWNTCLNIDDGAISGYSIFIGATGKGNGVNSMPIGLRSRGAFGTQYIATIFGSQTGGLHFKAGAVGGLISFQDANGDSYAYLGAKTLTTNKPLQLPGYTVAMLPACNASLKGAYVHATDIVSVNYNIVPVGGGVNDAPVYCDGTSWKIH
jgi:hypothetical protein